MQPLIGFHWQNAVRLTSFQSQPQTCRWCYGFYPRICLVFFRSLKCPPVFCKHFFRNIPKRLSNPPTGQKKRHQNLGINNDANNANEHKYHWIELPLKLNSAANGSYVPNEGLVVKNMIIKDSHKRNRTIYSPAATSFGWTLRRNPAIENINSWMAPNGQTHRQ